MHQTSVSDPSTYRDCAEKKAAVTLVIITRMMRKREWYSEEGWSLC